MTYLLSNAADADLLAILLEGIDRFGVTQAYIYRTELEDVFALLAAAPNMARLRRELTPPVRAHPHRVHVIVYDILENRDVMIQRIRHGREDWTSDPIGG